ncbi:integrase, catalytic region, zinc finger, CCHC-type containing protein [Tanacetum coccineum]
MSTSKTYQQSFADAGSKTRPPMLERGSYIQWANFIPEGSTIPRLQTTEDLDGDDLLLYDAEIEVMNMWKRVEREALVSVYNHFAQLMNDLERNNMNFPTVTINTKFLNSLQPEWLKYKLVNASRAKKLEKSHDPLALVAHTGSSFRQTSSYYVTHPTSMVDYDDEYQQDDVHKNSKDHLVSAMLLLAKGITQNFSNPRTQGEYSKQEFWNCPKPRVRNSKYFMKQMLLVKQDEAGVILTDEQNDFLFADASRMEEIKQLSANICLMARIQPTNHTSDDGPTYESAFINLEAKLKKNVDLILKLGNSLQRMFMLGPKPLSVYDQHVKHGLGYLNPYTLKQAILKCPKLYVASSLGNLEIPLNVRDSEDTLEDAFKNKILNAELEKVKKKSFEIQEGLQARIKILEKDVQRCQKQSVDFQLKLQHEKEKQKWDSTLKNKNTNPLDYSWISRMEKLKNENVSLEFKDLLSTISELKTRLEKVEKGANQNTNVIRPGKYRVVTTQELQTNKKKSALSSIGMNVTSKVRRLMSRDSHVAHSVLDNSKKVAKNVAVYVRKNKQTDNTSANVISNKENVIDFDVANASKAKTLLCVSCMQNVLIPCHDKCHANLKLNTMFSEKETQSKTLDTTSVVSKSKIDVESASKAKDKVVQIVLWVVDSGCSKHMTGLGHNLFNVGQFCDGDLEVAFHSNTCYVQNMEGDDLLTGGRESNLYTIFISDMAASSPVCLMSKANSTKSWLWHRRLSHLNFGTINDLTRLDLVDGLPKFKYGKDHLCSAYER